jgi:hypothetical protein
MLHLFDDAPASRMANCQDMHHITVNAKQNTILPVPLAVE